MQTITGKRHFTARRFETLRALLNYCAEIYTDQPAYRYHEKPGGREIVRSFHQYVEDIDCFGTGLLQMGLAGCHISIIGRNCYEWAVAHNGIVNGTGVSAPLDRLLPTQEVVHLCRRGDVSALIYHSQLHATALAVAAENQNIRWFIRMHDGGAAYDQAPGDERFLRFEDVLALGRKGLEAGDRSFIDATIDPEAMCSLVFTSGTGALSKGVMLCQRNITHNIHSVMGTLNVPKGQNALSILPLHHTFENTVGMYMVQAFGCCICFSDGFRFFNENLRQWHINILLGVPLVFDTLYSQIQKKLRQNKRLLLVQLLRHVTRLLRFLGIDLRRRIFRQILNGLGGGLNLIVCGAAAIDRGIVRFFNDIGIDFFCGYGLTEAAPVISVNNSFVNCYGSVGPPVADIEVAIDTRDRRPGAIGEILTRSGSVMLGYYKNPQDTAAVMTGEGWLRTGDLGRLDRHGCITLTGRLKSMIVLNSGKKAFPEEIEVLLNQIPGVRESFVWGASSGRGAVDICARLVIDCSQLPEDCRTSPELSARYLSGQLDAVNRQMPSYKEIRFYYFSRRDVIHKENAIDRQAEQLQIRQELKSRSLEIQKIKGRWVD
ncbi:MAG: AMP-binding protein [Bacillota bacterium]|nr:AMP-binding protein [Bacillota bacterium]